MSLLKAWRADLRCEWDREEVGCRVAWALKNLTNKDNAANKLILEIYFQPKLGWSSKCWLSRGKVGDRREGVEVGRGGLGEVCWTDEGEGGRLQLLVEPSTAPPTWANICRPRRPRGASLDTGPLTLWISRLWLSCLRRRHWIVFQLGQTK